MIGSLAIHDDPMREMTALLDAAAPSVREALLADPDTLTWLRDAMAAAPDEWPALDLDLSRFFAHVGARLPERPAIATVLPTLCVSDLFLACACALNVAGAAALFERRHADDIRRGLGSAMATRDEMHQEMLQHVLIATPERPPRIAFYTGRGPLGHWISVVTRRRLIDLGRAGRLERSEISHRSLAAAYGNPELALLHGKTYDALRTALERAAAAMEPRDRNILRYVYVHRLRIREVAAIYRCDESTIKRRVAKIRQHLGAGIRDTLKATLRLDERQLDRELADLPSVLPITLTRILRASR